MKLSICWKIDVAWDYCEKRKASFCHYTLVQHILLLVFRWLCQHFFSTFANLAPMILALRVTSFLSTIFHVPLSDTPDISACLASQYISEFSRISSCLKASVTNIEHGVLSTDASNSRFRCSYSQMPLRNLSKKGRVSSPCFFESACV